MNPVPVPLPFDDPPQRKPAKPNPVKAERQRLNAAAKRVLEFLKRHGEATNVELCDPSVGGMRFGGRIHELRRDGWLIDREHVTGGLWRYKFGGYR